MPPNLVPAVEVGFFAQATAHSVGQVMFQASIWTGLLFLLGIAVSEWRHAALALAGAVVGVLVAVYHFTLGADAIDPDRLIHRSALDVIKLGLYGFNATLTPVALYLWRKSLIAPLLGMLLTVPLTELVPMLGLVALTAPFVLATWIVLALGWLEGRLFGGKTARGVTSNRPIGELRMNLSPQERDKLLIYVAAQVARDRKKRGLKLNLPEAQALITAELMEMARDGKTVAEIMSAGREILKKGDVMEGVAELIGMIQVEPTFPDGSKLVTVHEPIR